MDNVQLHRALLGFINQAVADSPRRLSWDGHDWSSPTQQITLFWNLGSSITRMKGGPIRSLLNQLLFHVVFRDANAGLFQPVSILIYSRSKPVMD